LHSVSFRNPKLAAYQSVSVHGSIAGADPHALVQMLMDGALERLQTARACLERRDIVRKAKLLHSCVRIIAELRGSLNLEAGGPLAQNLSDLYEYMMRRLLKANVENDVACIIEVTSLLGQIRSAWVAIAPEVHKHATPAASHVAAPAAAAAGSAGGSIL
jgi:flagellar secretion chaperone FliS